MFGKQVSGRQVFGRQVFGRRGVRATTAACCAVALGAPALAADAGPGAPGIGDEYFPGYGNGGYDVGHYDVQLRYQPDQDRLSGTTTVVAEPTQDLTSFNLDFALPPSSVKVNGQDAEFTQDGTELQVTPPEVLSEGSTATFVVEYSGIPSEVDGGEVSPWIRTGDGALAVGQPRISAWWFPGNDHPRDKATFDISVAVPEGTQVVSNGVNTSTSTIGDWTTWKWRTTEPTATYLAFMAVGDYDINTREGAFGQQSITAYSAGLGELDGPARASVERTPEVLEFLSGLLGEYPVESQGGLVASEGLGFALENQTRPTYSPAFFRSGANTGVVVHENAHQWFGDSVSLDQWRDIWLNEGFSSYAEWLWSEHEGTGTAQELFDHYYAAHPADDPFWKVTPGDPGRENLFDEAVYDRGAMAVHALRNVIGDDALRDVVRTWVHIKRNSNGSVDELIDLAEQRTGRQLDRFFDAWLFTPAKPEPGPDTGIPAPERAGNPEVPAAVAQLDRTHDLLHGH